MSADEMQVRPKPDPYQHQLDELRQGVSNHEKILAGMQAEFHSFTKVMMDFTTEARDNQRRLKHDIEEYQKEARKENRAVLERTQNKPLREYAPIGMLLIALIGFVWLPGNQRDADQDQRFSTIEAAQVRIIGELDARGRSIGSFDEALSNLRAAALSMDRDLRAMQGNRWTRHDDRDRMAEHRESVQESFRELRQVQRDQGEKIQALEDYNLYETGNGHNP